MVIVSHIARRFASDQSGFSLVELMVVISIMSVLSMMILPQIAIFQIRAAQSEMLQNTRIIFTHINSYYAEHEAYPAGGGWGKSIISAPSINYFVENSYCEGSYPSPGGLRMNSCDKLRYVYSFFPPGSHGFCPNPADTACFIIDADGTGYTMGGATPYTYSPGAGVPTKWCKQPDGFDVYYSDRWYMTSNGVLTPFNNAAKNCFN